MAEEIADYLHGRICDVQAKEGLHPLNGAYHAVPGLRNSLSHLRESVYQYIPLFSGKRI